MTNPVVSVVTGTYNRLPYLQRMIASARRTWPRHLALEFVVADAGSTDGTLDWLRAQSDVTLIEEGELRGAIRAFTDAARRARGEYVVMANDDVEFHDWALIAALSHLDAHPRCAGVAFADNRSLQLGRARDYRVEVMTATDGRPLPYAQVGMFRRALGDAAGWWGADDPIMARSRTYGGDNFLSARLWEMGYTIDVVSMARVTDHIVRDALRAHNSAARGEREGDAFYDRYPTGVPVGALAEAVDGEHLRILHLCVFEPRYPQRLNREYGLSEALARYGWVLEWDYLNAPADLVAMTRAWQPHLILMQVQGCGPAVTPEHVRAMRAAAPRAVVVNWNGDAHEEGLVSKCVIQLLRHVDLQLTCNAAVLGRYVELGIPAAYYQIGYKDPAPGVALPDVPAHDVLWQGNWYAYRQPLYELLLELRAKGLNVGIYGNHSASNGTTHYDFAAQRALYSYARISIGDTFPGTVGFVSNRVFQALASGAFLLQQHSPELERWTGLRAGVHYVEWRTIDELRDLVYLWLTRDEARARIAQQGQAFVRANYNYDAQAARLLRLVGEKIKTPQ